MNITLKFKKLKKRRNKNKKPGKEMKTEPLF